MKNLEAKLEAKIVKKVRKQAKKPFNAVNFGGDVGSLFGRTGRKIGMGAGRLFRSITGFGDYKVAKNSLTSGDSLPMFRNGKRGTIITHREYLGDVITSDVAAQFKIETFPIQPALLSTFPWLANIGENFDEYSVEGMVFEFKSNSSNALNSVNTALGTVIMTTQYNVLAPPFTNKLQMEQYEFTCTAKPSVTFMHPIECARIETPTSVLTTRNTVDVPGDLRLYDWGNFNIATVGMQGTSVNIGELWVTYAIKFFKPKQGPITDVFAHFFSYTPAQLGFVESGGPAYFGRRGLPPNVASNSDLPVTLFGSVNINALDSLVFKPTYYGDVVVQIVWYKIPVADTVVSSGQLFINPSGGVTTLDVVAGSYSLMGTNPNQMTLAVPNGQTLTVWLRVAGGGMVTLTGGTDVAPLQSFDLYVTAIPAGFN